MNFIPVEHVIFWEHWISVYWKTLSQGTIGAVALWESSIFVCTLFQRQQINYYKHTITFINVLYKYSFHQFAKYRGRADLLIHFLDPEFSVLFWVSDCSVFHTSCSRSCAEFTALHHTDSPVFWKELQKQQNLKYHVQVPQKLGIPLFIIWVWWLSLFSMISITLWPLCCFCLSVHIK